MTNPLDRFTHRPVRRDSITFPLDPSDADRVREARQKVTRAQSAVDRAPEDANYLEALVDAEQALDELLESVVTIRFDIEAIGPVRVEELMTAHPIKGAKKAKALAAANGNPREVPQFDEDTFPPALLAEAVVAVVASDDPDHPQTEVTLDQMTALWSSTLSTFDRTQLFQMAMMINQAPSNIDDLGKG
jgi:hypothetical protein